MSESQSSGKVLQVGTRKSEVCLKMIIQSGAKGSNLKYRLPFGKELISSFKFLAGNCNGSNVRMLYRLHNSLSRVNPVCVATLYRIG